MLEHRRGLVRAGRHDPSQEELDVIAVLDKIRGQRAKNFGVPGWTVHIVNGWHQPAAEKSIPNTVNERAGKASICLRGEQPRCNRTTGRERRARIDTSNLRV